MTKNKHKLISTRNKCPICESIYHKTLLKIKQGDPAFFSFLKNEKFYSKRFWESYHEGLFNELKFEIIKCKNCGFVFQKEILNEYGMELLYNEWLDQDMLLDYYKKKQLSDSQVTLLKAIKRYFGNKSSIKLLDFGSGYGNFCSAAKKSGFNTFGFDLSRQKNEYISSRDGINSVTDLKRFSNYFHFINLNQVLEHWKR